MSLVATVLNEADSAEAWLTTILRQTHPPDEIVIVDAGSSDSTVEILRRTAEASAANLRVIVAPGLNISQGRNRAIKESRGEIIAVSDAGTTLEPHWLERLLLPLSNPEVDVVAGFFQPDGRNDFERVLARVITPRRMEIDPETFLPSSRSVAFRRGAWARAGGYPEWLRVCEDIVFDLRLRETGSKFATALDAVVSWYPAPTPRAYFNQWKRYARGDGHALLFGKRHAVRYGAYITGAGLLMVGRRRVWPRVVLVVAGTAYLRKFVSRLWHHQPGGSTSRILRNTTWVPAIVVTGDVAKMVGYPLGRWERWRAGGPEGLEHASIPSHRSLHEFGADDRHPVS